MRHIIHCHWLIGLSTLILVCGGCGESGPKRDDVSGAVTWKGQPVPNGVIFINPDTRKGNKGPQGFALIRNGRYDTRGKNSKGCSPGANVFAIQGCDGQNIGPGRPYGNSLFASAQLSIEIPSGGGVIDLVVPDTAKPATQPSESE
ncbi:MAG: hypothetical protein IT425_00075 [Pirellulales bacterium]|nr:hypothetical protein [Pirellulales bacterium]